MIAEHSLHLGNLTVARWNEPAWIRKRFQLPQGDDLSPSKPGRPRSSGSADGADGADRPADRPADQAAQAA